MNSLKQQLQIALKEAMKKKDHERRNAIRLLNSAIKQVEIDDRRELDDEAVLAVLQKEAKKHRETIAELAAAGRADAADSSRSELKIVEEFLPQQLSSVELRPNSESGDRRSWREFNERYGRGHEDCHAADPRPFRWQTSERYCQRAVELILCMAA